MNTPSQAKSRLVLLIVAAMFLGSFGVAAGLFFGGWRPTQTRNLGEMLDPYRDLRAIGFVRADGTPFAWEPRERRWHVLVAPPADCGAPCLRLLDALDRVRRSEGRHADRLVLLWAGDLPAGAPAVDGLVQVRTSEALQAQLPDVARADALPVYLVDPNGWLVMRYAPGFEPQAVRKDLGRLIK